MVTPKDGRRFLKFLPCAYSGSRFRVVLKDTGNDEQEPDKAQDKFPDSQCSALPDTAHDATNSETESHSKSSGRKHRPSDISHLRKFRIAKHPDPCAGIARRNYRFHKSLSTDGKRRERGVGDCSAPRDSPRQRAHPAAGKGDHGTAGAWLVCFRPPRGPPGGAARRRQPAAGRRGHDRAPPVTPWSTTCKLVLLSPPIRRFANRTRRMSAFLFFLPNPTWPPFRFRLRLSV